MPTYGLTPTGPVPKTTAIVREELQTALRGLYGEGCPLGSQTLLGTLTSQISDRCGSLWDAWLALFAAGDPDAAEDAALEVAAAFQLVLREGARPSLATLTLTGTAGTTVPSGSEVTIPDTATAFATLAAATLTAVPAWQANTAVAVGDRRHLGGRVYLCAAAGVTGSTGPSSTDYQLEPDGAAQWRYLGDGVAAADAPARCTEDGPTEAPAYSLTALGSSVTGWTGAVNTADALVGSFRQADNSLRVTRENALARAGAGTPDAIRADLLNAGARAVSVFSNRSTIVDADGVPPGSIEVLVTGGDDGVIAAALYASAGGSTGLHGSTVVSVVDSEGVTQEVRFSRPTVVPIYVAITVRRDAIRYAGSDEVSAKVVAYGDAQQTGVDVDALALAGQVVPHLVGGVLREQVAGVTGASACAVGTAPSPTGLSVAISRRQWADLDSSRVTVTEAAP